MSGTNQTQSPTSGGDPPIEPNLPAPGSRASIRTVLIVEDDDDVAALTADVLRDRGHTVYAAHDAQRAFARLAAVGVDVILLDLSLPDMTGEEFLALCDQDPRLATSRVVILSGSEDASTIAARRELALLRKPFGVDALLRAVEADEQPSSALV